MPKIKRDQSLDCLGKQPRKQRKKSIKTYTIYTPVNETWIFSVRASSKKEALDLYYNCNREVEQIGTESGHVYPETTVILEE